MRCPDCATFVSMETSEPELNSDPEVTNNDDGTASVNLDSVRITRNCANCSTELKEVEFQFDDVAVNMPAEYDPRDGKAAHEGHELSAEVSNVEATEESDQKPTQVKNRKTGKMETRYPNPRYTKTLIGTSVEVTVTCDTCKQEVGTVTFADNIPAGAMDEMV